MDELIIYGAGGHAKIVIGIIHKCRKYRIAALIDDDAGRKGERLLGEEVIGAFADLPRLLSRTRHLIIAVGDNGARHRLWERLRGLSPSYAEAVHPSATLGEQVTIGEGTVVMAGAIINCCTRIGNHSIVNTRSSIDHDCSIGDFVHIAPGVTLCGSVHVGKLSLVGAGATVLPGVTVGHEAVVGAGAIVIRDVLDGECVVGVPAKPLNRRKRF
jgi:sugar O-acyltransferase (sialic acid O-acetyltransferase NeuD family)